MGDLDVAIEWARRRAPKVLLRVERLSYPVGVRRVRDLAVRLHAPAVGSYRFYSVGAELVEDDDLEVERWPGDLTEASAGREPGYGGTVLLTSAVAACRLEPTLRYAVRCERARDGHVAVVERAHGLDEDTAVTWARERVPVVLVCLGAMDFQYFSAGERHLDELDIPHWDDRWETRTPLRVIEGQARGWTSAMKQGRRFPIDGSPDPDILGWTY